MKRFTFNTGSVPATEGEGVEWDTGIVTFREKNGGVWSSDINATLASLTDKYSRVSGWVLTYIDSADVAYPLGWENLTVTYTQATRIVQIAFTGPPGATWEVDWGDTNTTDGTIPANGEVTTSRTYATTGTYSITGTLEYGDDSSTLTIPFYVKPAAPTIVSISPDEGAAAGGTNVTITATGALGSGLTVTIGGNAVPSASIAVDGTGAFITAVTPAHAAGAVDVVISNANGQATLPAGFTYT